MEPGYHVDPAALQAAAPGFSAAGVSLDAASDAVSATIAAEGNCWGDDEAGRSFARGYEPSAQLALQGFGVLVEALHAIRAQLDAMAGTWQDVDAGTAAGFDRGTRA